MKLKIVWFLMPSGVEASVNNMASREFPRGHIVMLIRRITFVVFMNEFRSEFSKRKLRMCNMAGSAFAWRYVRTICMYALKHFCLAFDKRKPNGCTQRAYISHWVDIMSKSKFRTTCVVANKNPGNGKAVHFFNSLNPKPLRIVVTSPIPINNET